MKNSIWEFIDAKNQKYLYFIGVYIAIGGIYGLFLTIQNLNFELPISLFLRILMGLVFVFAVYSGYLLVKKQERGIDFAKIVMALQVLGLNVLGFKYFFFIGAAFGIQHNWEEDNVTMLMFNLNSVGYSINLNHDEYGNVGFFINILPILVIRYFLKVENKAEYQKLLTNNDE